ncbi:hypothetical protein GKODMF_04690 [Candidatus Electrothrix gigas]
MTVSAGFLIYAALYRLTVLAVGRRFGSVYLAVVLSRRAVQQGAESKGRMTAIRRVRPVQKVVASS